MTKSELLLKLNNKKLSFYEKSKIYEKYNIEYLNGKNEAAYYTKENVVKHIIDNLPISNKSKITILEPSVGIGNFIPQLLTKYKNKKINLILNDINKFSLECLKIILNDYFNKNNIKNVNLIYTNHDFLKYDFKEYKIDLIIGNPPYFTIKDKEYLKFCKTTFNDTSNNIFAYFILHSIKIAKIVSYIVPKNLLFAANYKNIRKKISNNIINIVDYNIYAFNVNLETISFVYNKYNNNNVNVKIENFNEKIKLNQKRKYIFNIDFPIWIIYRNSFFDNILNKIIVNSFDVYRDRQLTNSYLNNDKGIRVLRSKNIQKTIVNIPGYDKYIDIEKFNLNKLTIYKKIKNNKDIIIAPNLTPKPRFLKLPENRIINGSLALFIPKKNIIVKEKDLEFLNSNEFKKYFDIVRNKSIMTVNLDNYIGYFIGILITK